MTPRERILAVYRGEKPDVVPYMLDLSHWFYHRENLPWDLSKTYDEPEYRLIDCHKKLRAGFYLPNLASFFSIAYPPGVRAVTEKRTAPDGRPVIAWRLDTPLGSITRSRSWNPGAYSWAVEKWGIQSERDLQIFARAMAGREYTPHWHRFRRWDEYVGDAGVVYLPAGYSAMGHLLNLWMGVETTIYATFDYPARLMDAIDAVNENNLELIDLLCQSPAEIVLMGDNFSSDIQSPAFFSRWSQPYYREAVSRLHEAGKKVAVHIDGHLRGAIGMIRDAGADCADAVTPAPLGDLTPAQCRDEAGPGFILSGGVPPNLWLPEVPLEKFETAVRLWLDQKQTTTRFIANAGDQVPPGTEERRITLMRDLVEEHGRYDF